MKLAWNSLFIALSLLLSPATVLAESSQTIDPSIVSSPETIVVPNSTSVDELPPTDTPEAVENVDTSVEEEETSDTIEEAEEPELSPEEVARQRKLIEADLLYMSGRFEEAARLYQEAKDPFAKEVIEEVKERSNPISDPTQLSPAGSVYWRQAQAGFKQGLETKIFVPLELLVEKHSEFIPGHVLYAQALKQYNRHDEAVKVLERAINLYPHEAELRKAQIQTYEEQEEWLEASLVARHFALLNPENPETAFFSESAQQNMERYQRHLKGEIRGNAIANIITGAVGYALTGGLLGPLSAVESTALLLRGESGVGERVAEQAKSQLPLVEDEEIVAYVNEIGSKLTHVTGRDEFNYEFHVVMDDRLNAFALPGGKVFINAGAIMKTNSEAELAGLLAHELAHAVLSHGFQLVTQGSLLANISQYIPYGRTAANLIVLDYNRDMEREADELGTQILAASGYAADGLRNLMLTLEAENKERQTYAWLSTHPETKERVRNLEKQIVRDGYNRYAYEGVSRHTAMQERVKSLWEEYQESDEYQMRQERQQRLQRQQQLEQLLR